MGIQLVNRGRFMSGASTRTSCQLVGTFRQRFEWKVGIV